MNARCCIGSWVGSCRREHCIVRVLVAALKPLKASLRRTVHGMASAAGGLELAHVAVRWLLLPSAASCTYHTIHTWNAHTQYEQQQGTRARSSTHTTHTHMI